MSKRPRGGRGRRRPPINQTPRKSVYQQPRKINVYRQTVNFLFVFIYLFISFSFVLQFSAQKPAYRQPSSSSSNKSPYSYKNHDYRTTETPKTKLIESTIPKLEPKIIKPSNETIYHSTRSGEDHLTVTKSFYPVTTPKADSGLQQLQCTPVSRGTNVINSLLPKKCPWSSISRRNIDFDKHNSFRSDHLKCTPVSRDPNVINTLLPKKCPWDSIPRRNIDFDKHNSFRSDHLDRFGTEPIMRQSISIHQPDTSTKILLPWNEKYWNLFITNVNGFDDISARLIGDEYSVSNFYLFFIFLELVRMDSKDRNNHRYDHP